MVQILEEGPDVESGISSRPAVGAVLRVRREELGLEIKDVAVRLKRAESQIVALEAGNFKALPEMLFVRGFVRCYAKLLQIEPQPLLDALPGVPLPKPEVMTDVRVYDEKKRNRQNVTMLIAAFLITLLIAAFALWQSNTVSMSKSVKTVTTIAPLALPESAPIVTALPVMPASSVVPLTAPVTLPPAPVSPVTLPPAPVSTDIKVFRLVFDQDSWTEIIDKSGKYLSRQLNKSGSQLNIEGNAPYTLVIGHASTVHLFYHDKPVDMSSFIKSDVARMKLE
jgi:cytoskeleton protein RodZ